MTDDQARKIEERLVLVHGGQEGGMVTLSRPLTPARFPKPSSRDLDVRPSVYMTCPTKYMRICAHRLWLVSFFFPVSRVAKLLLNIVGVFSWSIVHLS